MKVIWTKRALSRLQKQLEFIGQTSENYKSVFVNAVYQRIEQLKQYPEIGMPSQAKKTVRSVRVDKNCRMYYRLKGKTIIIVYFFDARQNPEGNKYS